MLSEGLAAYAREFPQLTFLIEPESSDRGGQFLKQDKKFQPRGEVSLRIHKQKYDRYWEKLNELNFESTKFLK